MSKVKFPEGVCSVTLRGVSIPVGDDGVVDVAPEDAQELCSSFGGSLVVQPRAVVAAPPAPNEDDGANKAPVAKTLEWASTASLADLAAYAAERQVVFPEGSDEAAITDALLAAEKLTDG